MRRTLTLGLQTQIFYLHHFSKTQEFIRWVNKELRKHKVHFVGNAVTYFTIWGLNIELSGKLKSLLFLFSFLFLFLASLLLSGVTETFNLCPHKSVIKLILTFTCFHNIFQYLVCSFFVRFVNIGIVLTLIYMVICWWNKPFKYCPVLVFIQPTGWHCCKKKIRLIDLWFHSPETAASEPFLEFFFLITTSIIFFNE